MNRRRFWSTLAGASGVPAVALAEGPKPEEPKSWWDVSLKWSEDISDVPFMDAGGILTPKLAQLFAAECAAHCPRQILLAKACVASGIWAYCHTIFNNEPDRRCVNTGLCEWYVKPTAFEDPHLAAIAIDPETGKKVAALMYVEDYATMPPLYSLSRDGTVRIVPEGEACR